MKTPRFTTVIAALAALASIGCGGREGLTEREHGMVFYWEVESADLVWDQCTDAQDVRNSLQAPEFEENSFVVYRVSDDGEQLIDQSCETTDASSCVDSDLGIVFQRNGDVFEYDEPAVIGDEVSPGCSLQSDPLWTLEDAGQELFLDVSLQFSLVGTNCAGVDENIARSGTTPFGLDGCTATIEVVADYFRRQLP